MRKSLLFVYRDTLPLPLRRNPDTRATNANEIRHTHHHAIDREDSQQRQHGQPQLSEAVED